MNKPPMIDVSLVYGPFHDKRERVCVSLGAFVDNDAMRPVELSDDSMSLFLASPGMYGGKGNAIDIREAVFQDREKVAREISRALTSAILDLLGKHDTIDGYKKSDLSADEIRRRTGK